MNTIEYWKRFYAGKLKKKELRGKSIEAELSTIFNNKKYTNVVNDMDWKQYQIYKKTWLKGFRKLRRRL